MYEKFIPPPFITYAIPIFFVLIGIELGIVKARGLQFYRWNDSISDLSMGILSQLWGLFQKIVGLGIYFFFYESFHVWEFSMNSLWAWAFALVFWDFCYYWFHRLSHEVNLFWAGHTIHHQSEEYNLIVALRQTGLGGLFSWVFYLPMAIVGIPPWMYLASGQINLIYQFWVHTRVVDRIGKLGEFLLSTPSHHRVHHAINPKYIDRNHGGILIIWDRIFGTFQEEEEPCVYGTVKPLRSFNPVFANLQYYLELFKFAWGTPGIWNKIQVFLRQPGWIPPTRTEPAKLVPIPEVSPESFKKYDPEPPLEVYAYAKAWFVGVLLVSFAFLLFYAKFNFMSQILLVTWVTMSLVIIGGLIEDKVWARPLELVRVLSSFLILGYFGLGIPSFLIGLVFLALSTFFFYRTRDLNPVT